MRCTVASVREVVLPSFAVKQCSCFGLSFVPGLCWELKGATAQNLFQSSGNGCFRNCGRDMSNIAGRWSKESAMEPSFCKIVNTLQDGVGDLGLSAPRMDFSAGPKVEWNCGHRSVSISTEEAHDSFGILRAASHNRIRLTTLQRDNRRIRDKDRVLGVYGQLLWRRSRGRKCDSQADCPA